jgi:Outer membrane protein beta-barrel domain
MKKTFENQWQEALSDAHIPAPEGSWDWIEAELDKKKRKPILVFWNTAILLKLAAACMITLGIGSYLFFQKTKPENLSLITPVVINPNKTSASIENEITTTIPIEKTKIVNEDLAQNSKANANNTNGISTQVTDIQEITKIKSETFSPINENINTSSSKAIPTFESVEKITISQTTELNKVSEKSSEVLMDKENIVKTDLAYLTPFTLEQINVKKIQKRSFLPVEEVETTAEVKSESSKRWVGFQSGNSPFSPAYNSQTLASTYATQVDNSAAFSVKTAGSPSADANNNNIPYELFSGGNSRSFGLEVGKKIRKRWTVGAILRLSNAHINQRTNVFAINQKTGTVNTYFQSNYLSSNDKKDQVFTSVPSENTQTFKYIQIPVYIAYQLPIFSKLDLEFQTGISNDVFLGSKLKGDIVEDVNFTSKNSKYKILNFSGLAGLGLNLKISQNWRAVVQGNFQKALFSGTKGDLDFRPRFLGVNYGLRYVIM